MDTIAPTHAKRPDYAGGSIVNLIASISNTLGASDTGSVPLRGAELSRGFEARRRIVLLVIDGLGHRQLLMHAPARGALRAHLRGSMTSVFPSTTATAITTFLTGLAPAQHGITGWHMWFPEQSLVGAILPYRTRIGDRPLTAVGIEPQKIFGHRSLFERLPVASYAVGP